MKGFAWTIGLEAGYRACGDAVIVNVISNLKTEFGK